MELIDREKLLKELKISADHHEENSRDYVLMLRDRNIVREQPTVEAIPKADYEARLKADLEAILVELQLEIEELRAKKHFQYKHGQEHGLNDALELIQQKINSLKETKND